MKINQSRKSVQSVMCNPHFGGVLLKRDGVEMFVPKEWIFADGRLKGYAVHMWNKMLKEADKQKQAV